jgi:hypothetical protein
MKILITGAKGLSVDFPSIEVNQCMFRTQDIKIIDFG